MYEQKSKEYSDIYNKAMKDFKNMFSYAMDDLAKYHMQINERLVAKLLNQIYSNRDKLMNDVNGYFKYDASKNDFIWTKR